MDEDQTFLNLIAAEPENLTVRLVYCDWLEERNDPRHHYLRAWCQLANRPDEESTGDPEARIELATLARELSSEWLAAMNCLRFYLDFDTSLRLARRYLRDHFLSSHRLWIDPTEADEHFAGWYFPYRALDPFALHPFMTLFVHRGSAEVFDLNSNRRRFERTHLRGRIFGPPGLISATC